MIQNYSNKIVSYKRIISWILMLSAFLIVGIYLSRPLYDPDFYWHLKTGQWIWQNKSLPHTDPFGVPPFPEPSPRTEFILTSYWLIQLILYAFYSLSGMWGIIIFRWFIAGICLLVCIWWTNVRDNNVKIAIIIGTIQLLEFYFIERPQFVSFVCFGLLLVILFRFFEQRGDKLLWSTLLPLSLLMTIWANMHGGFIIGQTVLIYCIIAEGAKFFHRSLSPLSVQNYRKLLISSIVALLASLINQNAIDYFKYLPTIFDANNYANENNLEQLSVFEYFKEFHNYTIFIYLTSIVLTVGALFVSKHRKNITWIGIIVGAAFMGCLHIRLMPFFIVSAIIFMTKYFETECSALRGKAILVSMFVVTIVYCVSNEFPRINEVKRSGWVPTSHFPVKAADFLATNNIRGYIYTTMEWGGYMIWREGPENKIFYDGRILSLQRAWEYNNSRLIVGNQRPYWKGLFNIYNIQVAVLPIYENDGNPNLLTQSMYDDDEWKMVFASENEVIFIKNVLNTAVPG